jgi:hypothetical protein
LTAFSFHCRLLVRMALSALVYLDKSCPRFGVSPHGVVGVSARLPKNSISFNFLFPL